MSGGYKFAEGCHQLANVINDVDKSKDPIYNTPVGAMTESKANDNSVDLAAGVIIGGVSLSSVNFLNTISTVIGVKSTIEAVGEAVTEPEKTFDANTFEGEFSGSPFRAYDPYLDGEIY